MSEGRRSVALVPTTMSTCGAWRHLPTSANGQLAVASYLWDTGAGAYACWSIDVLTLRGDRISALTAFIGTEHFTLFGLPGSLP